MTELQRTPHVLVVIVNYRTPELTIDCLRSLLAERRKLANMEVIVTDNASGDDSVERLREFVRAEGVEAWMEIRPLPRNGGFAYGNNEALRGRLQGPQVADYFLLLNPDTIVRPGAIVQLVEFLEAHPDIGLAGSRLEDPDGTPQRSAFRFPSFISEIDRSLRWGPFSRCFANYVVAPPVSEVPIATDWVAGASVLVRRAVFETIGLLDEGYFMYYEEVDFCWRARRAHWPCWYVPASRVVHLVGQASGVTNTRVAPKRRPDYWFESRRRFFLRNRGRWYTAVSDLSLIVGLLLWRLRCWMECKVERDPPRFLWDSIRHSVLWRGFRT